MSGHFLIRLAADSDIVKVKLFDGDINIVTVNFIKVGVDCTAKHIVYKRCSNCTLFIKRIRRYPLCLTGGIPGQQGKEKGLYIRTLKKRPEVPHDWDATIRTVTV